MSPRHVSELFTGLHVFVETLDATTTRVRVEGELDLTTSETLEHELGALVDSNGGPSRTRSIIVDLSGVTFLDSTGLRALWSARQRAQDARTRFVVDAPSEPVMRVLRITKLDKVFLVLDER